MAVTLFSRVFIRYYEAIEIPRDDVWIFRSVIKTVKFKEVPDSLNWFMIIGHYTTQCFGYIGLYIIYIYWIIIDILDYTTQFFLIYWIVLGIIIEKTLWTLWTSIMTEGFRVHGWFSSWNIRIKIDDLGIPLCQETSIWHPVYEESMNSMDIVWGVEQLFVICRTSFTAYIYIYYSII